MGVLPDNKVRVKEPTVRHHYWETNDFSHYNKDTNKSSCSQSNQSLEFSFCVGMSARV